MIRPPPSSPLFPYPPLFRSLATAGFAQHVLVFDPAAGSPSAPMDGGEMTAAGTPNDGLRDRKSTRLNSSHDQISYAVFCLKKKKKNPSIHSVSNVASAHRLA